jgi:hypothetical protein
MVSSRTICTRSPCASRGYVRHRRQMARRCVQSDAPVMLLASEFAAIGFGFVARDPRTDGAAVGGRVRHRHRRQRSSARADLVRGGRCLGRRRHRGVRAVARAARIGICAVLPLVADFMPYQTPLCASNAALDASNPLIAAFSTALALAGMTFGVFGHPRLAPDLVRTVAE